MLVSLSLSALLLQAPETFTVPLARVVATRPQDVAGAQVQLPDWQSLAIGSRWSKSAVSLRTPLAGRAVQMVLDTAETGGALDRLWVDADDDATVDDGETLTIAWDQGFGEVDLLPLKLPLHVVFFQHRNRVGATARTLYHFAGAVDVRGEAFTLLWIDMNLDGAASAQGDRWVALPKTHLDTLSLANAMFMARELDEPWFVGTDELRCTKVDSQGQVTLALTKPRTPRHEVLAARAARVAEFFSKWFDAERDEFFAQHKIAADRAPAQTPPAWHYTLDFADAVAHAQTAGKPLLVEFSTDGCPWCKRLDWLNYKDAEVVARLQGFALVKLNNDLDRNHTADKLGLKGVPKTVVFGKDGAVLHTIGGWLAPAEHAVELDRARVAAGLPAVASTR